MGEQDYSTVAMIAGERADIGMTCSSTPTGKRGTFYQMCTDKRPTSQGGWGFTEHYHPSMHNPNWCQQMEDEFRAELTSAQYDHEILAIFGTEETGVFNKEKLDMAQKRLNYTYDKLTDAQFRAIAQENGPMPDEYFYDEMNVAPHNIFRCVGVDWDKFQASSSIVVLDYNVQMQSFQVIKRIEVPRSEYTLDNAVNWVVRVNRIFKPAWIFCDRGYGDYQIERLHIYGDEHPETGLKNKVVGYQFKESLDVIDPITQEKCKEPLKQFMVNQLNLTIERDRLILSPYDNTLHKQLIDYSVSHVSANGMPVYTSENEHFVDALGLAHLAFVLKFPKLTQAIKPLERTNHIEHLHIELGNRQGNIALNQISNPMNPWKNSKSEVKLAGKGPGERRGDYQQWVKVPVRSGGGRTSRSGNSWGKRGGSSGGGRSMW